MSFSNLGSTNVIPRCLLDRLSFAIQCVTPGLKAERCLKRPWQNQRCYKLNVSKRQRQAGFVETGMSYCNGWNNKPYQFVETATTRWTWWNKKVVWKGNRNKWLSAPQPVDADVSTSTSWPDWWQTRNQNKKISKQKSARPLWEAFIHDRTRPLSLT